MNKITTWKDFVECLPIGCRVRYKKYFRKIFSICAKNYWSVRRYDDYIEISQVRNDIKVYCKIPIGDKVSYNTGVIKIDMNIIEYLNTGYEFVYESSKEVYCVINVLGEVVVMNGYFDINKLFMLGSDIVSIRTLNSYNHEIIRDINYFRKLDYEEAHTYCHYLCLQDCSIFKKGMIIDASNLRNSWYVNQNPLEMFNGYRVAVNVVCNLALVKLADLEAVKTDSHSCYKRAFGCQRGCMNSCMASDANSYNAWLKNVYIKLWNEVFNNKL